MSRISALNQEYWRGVILSNFAERLAAPQFDELTRVMEQWANDSRAHEWAASHRAQYDALVAALKVARLYVTGYRDMMEMEFSHSIVALTDEDLALIDAALPGGATAVQAGHAAPAVPASAQGGERQ
jgi:hypothetical protein